MSYDLAHSKGQIIETAEEKRARKEAEKRRHERQRRRLRKEIMKERRDDYYFAVKRRKKELERRAKAKVKAEAKAEARRAAEIRGMARAGKGRGVHVHAPGKGNSTGLPQEVEASAEPESTIGKTTSEREGETNTRVAETGVEPKSKTHREDIAYASSSAPSMKTPSAASNESGGGVSRELEQATDTKTTEDAEPAEIPECSGNESTAVGEKTGNKRKGADDANAESNHETLADEEAKEGGSTTERKVTLKHAHPRSEVGTESGPMYRGRRGSYHEDGGPGSHHQHDAYFKGSDDGDAGPCPSPSPESDSDLDISSISDISDRELDLELEHMAMEARRRRQASPQRVRPPPPPPPRGESGGGDESPDEFESDPWNAVATVGLRVYYKVPVSDGEGGREQDVDEEVVKLRVVRPNPYLPKYDSEGDSSSESEGDDDTSESAGDKDNEAEEKGKDNVNGVGDMEDDKKKDDPVSSQGLDIDDSSKDATLVGDQEQRRKSILSTQIPPI